MCLSRGNQLLGTRCCSLRHQTQKTPVTKPSKKTSVSLFMN